MLVCHGVIVNLVLNEQEKVATPCYLIVIILHNNRLKILLSFLLI